MPEQVIHIGGKRKTVFDLHKYLSDYENPDKEGYCNIKVFKKLELGIDKNILKY